MQLNELVAAIRSPIRAAAEHQQQSIGSHQVIQRSGFTALIGQRKRGNLVSYRRPSSVIVVLGLDESEPVLRRDVCAAGSKLPTLTVLTPLPVVIPATAPVL